MTARHAWLPPVALLVVGLILGGSLVACTGGPGTVKLAATCDDFAADSTISQAVEAKVGDEIAIELCSNPSTGFAWEDPVVGDASVVELVASNYREPAASPGVAGAAGTQRVTLRAAGAGTSTVTLSYSRPWEGGEKGAWTYEVTVTVR